MKNYLASTAVCLGLTLNSAIAFEVEHEAHEHGHATLSIAQEKSELQLLFKSPAMNIVGFEHQPSSKEQHAKVDKAKDLLSHPEKLFTINSEAKCSIEHVNIASALLADDGHEEHGHKKHDDHHDDHKEDHKDEHHHDHHAKHKEQHDHHKDEHHGEHAHHEETHSEFEAEYHFECDNIASLNNISVSLFKSFSSLEEVEAQVVTSKGQRLVELDHDNVTIEL